MIRHTLSLEVPDTKNPTILRLVDTSIYADGLQVNCPTLHVTAPGFIQPAEITVTKDFIRNLTAADLGIGTVDSTLSDGVYVIRYSVSPNDKVYVEYNHLRVTNISNRYHEELCRLALTPCEAPADIKERGRELQTIKLYIDAAKAKVEYCHQMKQGIDLLTYADKLLTRYTTKHCLNC